MDPDENAINLENGWNMISYLRLNLALIKSLKNLVFQDLVEEKILILSNLKVCGDIRRDTLEKKMFDYEKLEYVEACINFMAGPFIDIPSEIGKF